MDYSTVIDGVHAKVKIQFEKIHKNARGVRTGLGIMIGGLMFMFISLFMFVDALIPGLVIFIMGMATFEHYSRKVERGLGYVKGSLDSTSAMLDIARPGTPLSPSESAK